MRRATLRARRWRAAHPENCARYLAQARAQRAATRAARPPWEAPGWCWICCECHTPARRQAILRRLGDVTAGEVRERLEYLAEHLWPMDDSKRGGSGERKLLRDLRAVRGHPKLSSTGADQRLEHALRLIDKGTPVCWAALKAGCNRRRIVAALHAQGLTFRNTFRPELRGWVRA